MMYHGLKAVVFRLKDMARIKKRIYPHLFRHSRVTHLLSTGLINEAQAKVYFGWTPDSRVLAEYSHLVSRDADQAILAINGIKVEKDAQRPQIVACPRCQRPNAPEARFCIQCSSVLDSRSAFREDDTSKTDRLLDLLLKDVSVQRAIAGRLESVSTAVLKELL